MALVRLAKQKASASWPSPAISLESKSLAMKKISKNLCRATGLDLTCFQRLVLKYHIMYGLYLVLTINVRSSPYQIDVNGSNEHPLFTYLKSKCPGFLVDSIKWNFTKFVISAEGMPVARFGPGDDPIPKVEKEIIKALQQAGKQ